MAMNGHHTGGSLTGFSKKPSTVSQTRKVASKEKTSREKEPK